MKFQVDDPQETGCRGFVLRAGRVTLSVTWPAETGHPHVTLMRHWRLRPWKQVHILAGNLDACRWATERFGGERRE